MLGTPVGDSDMIFFRNFFLRFCVVNGMSVAIVVRVQQELPLATEPTRLSFVAETIAPKVRYSCETSSRMCYSDRDSDSDR